MKRIVFALLFVLFFIVTRASPLHVHTEHDIIVSTDCAIDDMRAINMLLSLSNVSIKAFIVSDGSLPPSEGAVKLHTLLQAYNCDTIPVIMGEELKDINPPWREFNRNLKWAEEGIITDNIKGSMQDIIQIIEQADEHISLLCLGPMTDISQLLKNGPDLKSKVEEVIWYNESAGPLKGFNYECDKGAAEAILNSGLIVYIISNLHNEKAVFDISLYQYCRNNSTVLAKNLYFGHSQSQAYEKLKENHFKLWDELTVIFLTNPELFSISPLPDNSKIRRNTGYSAQTVRQVMMDIISARYKAGEFIAFYGFPADKFLYTYDIREIMDTAIALYGLDEWKACVMTDEFHGHLGIFSIVGAKMGITARDYFQVGNDLLAVVSFAGMEEPFSCMNDGIQVSTGATLGQGSITVSTDTVMLPSAIFSYGEKSVRITLKDEYLQKVKTDIQYAKSNYGLADEAYWFRVRQNAIKYWLNWDRNEIFELKVLHK